MTACLMPMDVGKAYGSQAEAGLPAAMTQHRELSHQQCISIAMSQIHVQCHWDMHWKQALPCCSLCALHQAALTQDALTFFNGSEGNRLLVFLSAKVPITFPSA